MAKENYGQCKFLDLDTGLLTLSLSFHFQRPLDSYISWIWNFIFPIEFYVLFGLNWSTPIWSPTPKCTLTPNPQSENKNISAHLNSLAYHILENLILSSMGFIWRMTVDIFRHEKEQKLSKLKEQVSKLPLE